jgi:glycosyltransferase involved in cell wall biosynthesis
MQIILTSNYSPWSAYSGGGQQSTHELATALVRRGHDVTVVFTKTPWERVRPPSSLLYSLRWAALYDYRSRASAPLRVLSAWSVAAVVRRELASRRTTVVHAQGEEAARLHRERPCRRFGLVVSPRYPSLPHGLVASPRPAARALGLIAGYGKYAALGVALRTADVCAPPSRYGGDLIRRAYQLSEQRIHPVHNGVPAEFLQHEWRPCLGRDTRPALFFGRFERSKGPDILLRALHELGQDAPHVRLVGRGTYRAAMARMREDLGLTSKVEFHEWVGHRELGRLLAQSSMVILPSREENFALAALAAMAVGTPLVTTNVGGVAELVEHGESGVLCPANDATALSDAILQLRTQPERASALGARARGRVRDNFTWEVAVRKFESLYDQLT